MQTFLPDPDFAISATALDNRRLGKQRVETLQVMRALTIPGYGWQHHPVVAMWRGYRPALMDYQVAICTEWVARGFSDSCLDKTLADLALVPEDLAAFESGDYPLPPWMGRPEVHQSHRSKLIAKEPDVYRARFPDEVEGLDYVWPISTARNHNERNPT
jgi:hypothetical protein